MFFSNTILHTNLFTPVKFYKITADGKGQGQSAFFSAACVCTALTTSTNAYIRTPANLFYAVFIFHVKQKMRILIYFDDTLLYKQAEPYVLSQYLSFNAQVNLAE
jgi:hypothetical protein